MEWETIDYIIYYRNVKYTINSKTISNIKNKKVNADLKEFLKRNILIGLKCRKVLPNTNVHSWPGNYNKIWKEKNNKNNCFSATQIKSNSMSKENLLLSFTEVERHMKIEMQECPK